MLLPAMLIFSVAMTVLPCFGEDVGKSKTADRISKQSTTSTLIVEYQSELDRVVRSLETRLKKLGHHVERRSTKEAAYLFDATTNKNYHVKARKQGNRADVEFKEYLKLTKLYPNNNKLWMLLSLAHEERQEWANAIRYIDKNLAVTKVTDFSELQTASERADSRTHFIATLLARRGYDEAQLGNYSKAVENLSESIRLMPEFEVSYRNRAAAYTRLGQAALAQRDLAKLNELKSTGKGRASTLGDWTVFVQTVDKYLEKERFSAAISEAQRGLARYPKHAPLHYLLAEAYMLSGMYQQANNQCDQLLKILPHSTTAKALKKHMLVLCKRGVPPYGDQSVLAREKEVLTLGDHENVTGVRYSDYAKDHPGDARVYKAIASGLLYVERYADAEKELEKLAFIDPSDAYVLILRIQLADARHKWQEAVDLCTTFLHGYEGSINFEPNLYGLQYGYEIRARSLKKLRRYDQALQDYSTLLKFESDSSEFYRDRADCNLAVGKYQAAVTDYTKSIELDPDKVAKSYELRAIAYDKIGRKDLAYADRKAATRAQVGVTATSGKARPTVTRAQSRSAAGKSQFDSDLTIEF